MRVLTSLTGGVKIEKIAIAPGHGVRLFSPLGHLFWYVFAWDLLSSRATAFTFAALVMADVFALILCPHTWYVDCHHLAHYFNVLQVALSRGRPLACQLHCRALPCRVVQLWGTDPLVGCPHRFTLAQEGL